MYTFHGHKGFGFTAPVTVVGTAIANVGVNAHHAVKVSKMQQKFSKRLESDQEKMAYLKLVILRVQSIAERLAKGGKYRPGTPEFEKILGVALKNDMAYKGLCNADIYYPLGNDPKGSPRAIWASISRGGYVTPGTPVPPDVGPIWATGCKNADDRARMAYVQRFKGRRKHKHFRTHKEDIGTMDLFLRAGTGILMVAMLFLVTRIQKAVISEQAPPKRKRRKKKKKPAE
jgi:hypothetical protein